MSKITLKNLIDKYNWEDITDVFYVLFVFYFKYESFKEFEKVYNTLKNKKITDKNTENYRICIEKVTVDSNGKLPENVQYYEVFTRNGIKYIDRPELLESILEKVKEKNIKNYIVYPEKEIEYNTSLSNWDKWLSWYIDEKTLEDFPETDIICHCLYYMTKYTMEDISQIELTNLISNVSRIIKKGK